MLFVGIDVASKKHDIAITSSEGDIIVRPFTISNDLEGFKKLPMVITSHTESVEDVRIGIEETGIYSKNISEFLALHGFIVHMINPVLTNHSRKSQSLRPAKTDKIDALAICRYIQSNFKRLNSYTPSLYIHTELKSLTRARFDILKNQIKAKTEWTRLLDLVFPEFRQHFKQHSKWVYNLFSKYPTVEQISRMHLSTLEHIIKVQGDRVLAAQKIKLLAMNTIGHPSDTNGVLLTNTLCDIMHYASQLRRIEKQIKSIVAENFAFLLTVPGIGDITGATIIGEIGDINRFHSSSALVAFAGMDPAIHESGDFRANTMHISKRGSRYLRAAVFLSTRAAIINPNIQDNKFREKYLKKIAQGKHHNSAICSASKNMINVIYSLMKSHESFNYFV
jgi:transposase